MNAIDTQTLLTHLTSPDAQARLAAAIELGIRRDPATASGVVARLGVEDDFHVRENLTWAAVQLIDAALPDVLVLLRDPNPLARRQAAHVLSKVGDASLAVHLTDVIADADPQVAVKAYRAAASTGSPEVVGPLVARLSHGDLEQRDALTVALARLGETAVPALVDALADPDADVRAHAADTLGHLGSPDADPAADALARLTSDADPHVALAAVSALGELGGVADTALRTVADAGGPLSGVALRLVAARPAPTA